MSFEKPFLLWLLAVAVPALAAFFWWSARTRQRLIAQFVQARLLAHLTVGASRHRQIVRAALLTACIALTIVVIARPRWGFAYEEARQKGLDIIVAIDTSRSMMAADIAPNRLARAKLAAMDLKRLARTDRVGLIAFAGTAFLQCPLSYDDEAFRQNIETLDVNIIPQGGSALGEAIITARKAFEEKSGNFNVLVLFSDGEDNEGAAVEAAKAAAQEGMRIFTVGVGTPNGELLRVTDNKGRSDYVRDDAGNVVKSRLNEQLLRDIAGAGSGFFMLLAGATTMDMLYERGLAPLPQSEQSVGKIKRFHERYQWFLGLAMILLLTEMFLPERQKRAPTTTATAPLARAALIALLCVCSGSVFGSPSTAIKKYRSGNFDSAQAEFERLLKEKPDDSRLRFNAGTAAFQGGDYEAASKYFNSALLTPDIGLQQQSYYNLGNAQYRVGENGNDPTRKKEEWEAAVRSYESALKLSNADTDARHNLEFVKKQLEELKKQEQEKKENQDKQDQKKDEEKKDDQQKQDQQKDEKKEEEKKSEEEKKNGKENEEKKPDPQKPEDKQKQEQGEQPKEPPSSEGGRAIPMTPKEAQRLLDTLRSEERAMIFLPANRTNRNDRILKDW